MADPKQKNFVCGPHPGGSFRRPITTVVLAELPEGLLSHGLRLCCFAEPVTQPFIRITDATVRVQSSVILTCLSADTGTSTQWLFNNQNLRLTERMTLSPSKCRLRIDPVRREDAGEYRCEVSNPVSLKTSLPVCLAVVTE